MATSENSRNDRIASRTTSEQKSLLAKGAVGERIVLSERDTTRVLELLENPPEPTQALLKVAQNTQRS